MLEITRAQARLCRSILRATLVELDPQGLWPVIGYETGPKGILLHAHKGDAMVSWHQPGKHLAGRIAFRANDLAEFEGRSDDPVQLQARPNDEVQATWQEAGVPREVAIELIDWDTVPPLPKLPSRFAPLPPEFLPALEQAVKTAGKTSIKYALTYVQLSGKEGEVIATDGRQLLIQRSFRFPWSDDVLLPALPFFAKPQLWPEGPVQIGRTKTHLAMRLGAWTFLMPIETDRRFPDVRKVIPRANSGKAKVQIDPDDAQFLLKALPRLPAAKEEYAPVTLEVKQPPVLRAKELGGDKATEVELSRSAVHGKSPRLCMDRHYLLRACQMGFGELEIEAPEKPVCCRVPNRIYIWLPLEKNAALPPHKNATLIRSTDAASHPVKPSPQRRKTPMTTPSPNGRRSGSSPERPMPAADALNSPAELLAEAEELRRLLQEFSNRFARLLSALKQFRKERRVFRAAVESLRQLNIDG